MHKRRIIKIRKIKIRQKIRWRWYWMTSIIVMKTGWDVDDHQSIGMSSSLCSRWNIDSFLSWCTKTINPVSICSDTCRSLFSSWKLLNRNLKQRRGLRSYQLTITNPVLRFIQCNQFVFSLSIGIRIRIYTY